MPMNCQSNTRCRQRMGTVTIVARSLDSTAACGPGGRWPRPYNPLEIVALGAPSFGPLSSSSVNCRTASIQV